MGDPVAVSLGTSTNPARHQQAGNAKLINCFAEEQSEDGKVTIIIYGTEGLAAFGSPLEASGVRAGIEVDGTAYVVCGRNIYAINASGVGSLIGGIAAEGPVYMERNRKVPPQIGVVSDGLYVVIDTGSNSVAEISDPDLPSPVCISFLDGYGVIPVITGSYMLTGLDEFTTIDALDEGTCEAYPDSISRSLTLEREAVFMGPLSIEWHQDTGDADFPFTPVHSTELGILAGDSAAKVDTPTRKTIIWVAPDHTVRMMNGYAGQVISTNEIEDLIKALDRAGNAADLKGFSWAAAGRFFYALTCNDWTRVFDSKTGKWHTRQSYGLDRWRISTVFKFGSKIIAGDYANGQLYSLDDTVFSENGDYQVMDILTPTIHAFPYPLKFNWLYIDAATGVGLNSVMLASDPKLLISWSDDGGYSFSPERERSLGMLGQNGAGVAPISRLGRTGDKGRIFKLRISSPVQRVALQLSVDYDRLTI